MATQLGNSLFVKCAIEHELAMADLYGVYSNKLSGEREFWLRLADDEREQAQLISQLQEGFACGAVELNSFRVPARSIIESTVRVKQTTSTVRNWGVSRKDAYEFALDVEGSVIEQDIFTAFRPANDFLVASLQLTEETNRAHFKEMESKANGGVRALFNKLAFWS